MRTICRPFARLANLYEQQRQYGNAISIWEEVRKAVPHDGEAIHKINNLSAAETIVRGNYRR